MHADTIAVAVAEDGRDGEVRSLGIIANEPTAIRKLIKTDRRDAIMLARTFRAGDLTAVWVPDQAHEALRDLVRAREAAKQDQHRSRQRLGKFLLRTGRRPPKGSAAWGTKQVEWIRAYLSEVDP